MKTKLFAVALFLAVLQGCGGGGSSAPTTQLSVAPTPQVSLAPQSDCTGNAAKANSLKFGIYAVANHEWGVSANLPAGTPFTECVYGQMLDSTTFSAKWTWALPQYDGVHVLGGPISFPTIIAGNSPDQNIQTVPVKPVSQTDGTNVKYSVTIDQDGLGTTFFQLTFSKTSLGTLADLISDVSIGVKPSQLTLTWLTKVDSVTIDGNEYDVYINPTVSNSTYHSVFFNIKQPNLSGTMHVKPYVDYLIGKGYLKQSDYLAGVEFGTEVVSGNGAVTISQFVFTQ